MALYRYKAVTPAGEMLEGQMEVASNDEVIAKLQDAGNIPLEVREASDAGGAGGLGSLLKRSAMGPTQVLQFTQQLAVLLGAGQPLDRALQILLELPESEKAKRIVERIRDHVRGGAPLSDGLEAEPGVFSKLYVNMVRAGEIGGSLDQTLARLANYLERSKALKESVINAMIYPAILVVMVFAALFVLLVFASPSTDKHFLFITYPGGVNALVALVSFGVSGIYLSFLLTVIAALVARARGWIPEGRFTLGSWGVPVTVSAIVYLGLMLINVVLPSGLSSPRGLFNIDWITLVVMFVIAVVGAAYFFAARPDRGVRHHLHDDLEPTGSERHLPPSDQPPSDEPPAAEPPGALA